MRRCALLFCLSLWGIQVLHAETPVWQAEHDGVLGTSFAMTVVGLPEARTETLADEVLAEIRRLEGIFSTWRDDSEIAMLNRDGRATRPSPELMALLALCEHWQARTEDAFSCRLGSLLAAWRQAESDGAVPDRTQLRRQARAMADADLLLEDGGVDLDGVVLEPAGIAKGYILDRIMALARARAPDAAGLKIDIGGDGIYSGHNAAGRPWRVAAGQPGIDHDADRGVLELSDQAVAFSGHNRRYREINGRRFSHVLNPADGWPPAYAPSAVVVATDATTADALATALTVMPMRAGLDLVEQLPGVEALVLSEGGTTFASGGWYHLLSGDARYRPTWDDGMRFVIEYRIPEHRVAQYRRPYVAAWITGDDRRLVRQLLLHGGTLRWLRELPTWWRRHGRRDDTVIDGLARPTPRPGQHLLAWDGRDDGGRPVPPGHYQLHIEAAREHGSHEVLVLPFELDGQPFEQRIRGERELGEVRVTFGPSDRQPPASPP